MRRSGSSRTAAGATPVRPSHGPIQPVKPATDLALPAEEVHASSGPFDWKTLVVAGLLALGFSSTFLGPLLPLQTERSTGGVILGDSVSRPLAIPVTIINGSTVTVTTQPISGTVTDALARAAAGRGGSLQYTSREDSIYLQSYLGQENSATGSWTVRLNGVPVVDLSQPVLAQGDRLIVEWSQP